MGLDPETKKIVWTYIKSSLSKDKRALIVASNDPEEALDLGADKIIKV